jgi:hypothetical protein
MPELLFLTSYRKTASKTTEDMKKIPLNLLLSTKTARAVEALLLLAAAVFLALHGLHLKADFPNHSPWMDWAKYTDEGWYGDGAIRHFQRGHWYVPGDFNPAVALPVWPLLEAVLFRFTGVSLMAARALTVGIFALILLCSYLLLQRWHSLNRPVTKRSAVSLAPAIAVLLLAVSPFCYAFTRMAILEPLLILLTLMALLAASYAAPPGAEDSSLRARVLGAVPLLALGLLLPLMVLTKTTAVFLFPAIAWLLWARAGYKLRPFLQIGILPSLMAGGIWLGYFGLFVRPNFLEDYHYLFSANAYTGITLATAFSVFRDTVSSGIWMGKLLYPLALLAAVSILLLRLLRPQRPRNPLIGALLLWALGYAGFLAYHDNLQPRYYLVVAVPLTLLVPVVFEALRVPVGRRFEGRLRLLSTAGVAAALVLLAATDARQTIHYVRHPEYTFTSAAGQIHDIIAADHNHNPLVLSISGSNLSLMTGLPSICDDFGTMDLEVRVRAYHPGWYVAWNQVEDDKMEALAPMYNLQRIAEFPAMDDPDRNLLILYRLDPPTPNTPPRHRRKAVIPHLLQTSFGQQPSVIQLQH